MTLSLWIIEPFFIPWQGAFPTPNILFDPSSVLISAIRQHILEVPISIPISIFFSLIFICFFIRVP